MIPKSPTRIRVFGAEHPIGKCLIARLAELGYDIVVDIKYSYYPPLKDFYNIIWEDKTKHYVFSNYVFEAHERYLTCDELLIFRVQGVTLRDFVDFSIYCWGMHRGDRLPFEKQLEVTQERIKEWKLTDLL